MHEHTMDILQIDGVEIPCRFLHPETRSFFKKHITEQVALQNPFVCLGPEEMRLFYSQYPINQQNAAAEIKLLIPLVSDWLLDYQRILMHGVAFAYKNRAWILSGESGVGKTTQYRNLKRLYGDAIQIICGDNPVLNFSRDSRILVCPSPWNGKEKYGSEIRAELGGIVLLEQGKLNEFFKPPSHDIAIPLLGQIMTYMKTEYIIHKQIAYERMIIETIPIFQYRNTGTEESSWLLLQQINKILE